MRTYTVRREIVEAKNTPWTCPTCGAVLYGSVQHYCPGPSTELVSYELVKSSAKLLRRK